MVEVIYAGSFDPPTNGHVWVVKEGLTIFSRLVWAVAENPRKKEKCDFSAKERTCMLEKIAEDFPKGTIEVDYMGKKLLVDFAQEKKIRCIIRGMRNLGDFDYELDLRDQNHKLNSRIKPWYVIPPPELRGLHSQMVKDYIGFDRWEEIVKGFVPEPVYKKILEKYQNLRTKK
jgi:pantetheine-phosphate adenylyltransferase